MRARRARRRTSNVLLALLLSSAGLILGISGCAEGEEVAGTGTGLTTAQGTGGGGQGGEGGGAMCTPGTTEPCYSGPAGTDGVGQCAAGTRTCAADGSGYGACVGEVKPGADACATPEDEDCDGANTACSGEPIWSKAAGDVADQRINAIAVGASGDIVVTGAFAGSIDFGGQPLFSSGGYDVFVAKLTAAGKPVWSRSFGDDLDQSGNGVAVDSSGNVFVTGDFKSSIDFGGGSIVSAGAEDMFALKLDSSGKHVWSKGFGDAGFQSGRSAAIDPAENLVLWATLEGTTMFGGAPLVSVGSTDVGLIKLNPGGNHLYSQSFGGASAETAGELALDEAGAILITGSFAGSITFGGAPLASAGGTDVFATRFTGAGIHLWSKRFGDAGDQSGRAVAVDATGNVILAGAFLGKIDFGGGSLTSAGSEDIYVAKLDEDGAHVWSMGFGDAAQQAARAVAADASGNVFVVGSVAGSVDFGGGAQMSAGGADVFYAKLDPTGAHVFSVVAGAADEQAARAVAVDPSGAAVVGGHFKGSLTLADVKLTAAGSYDLFLAKIAP